MRWDGVQWAEIDFGEGEHPWERAGFGEWGYASLQLGRYVLYLGALILLGIEVPRR